MPKNAAEKREARAYAAANGLPYAMALRKVREIHEAEKRHARDTDKKEEK